MFFFLFTTPVGALLPKRKILVEHARRLRSRDYFDVIYSTYRLVYNMDEWRICGNADFSQIKMETGRFRPNGRLGACLGL